MGKTACVFIGLGLVATHFSYAGEARHAIEGSRGTYRGEERNGAIIFPNISYAKPPVGSYRWRRTPMETRAIQGKETVACPAIFDDGFLEEPPLPKQEDCLYMNVWKPNDQKTKLPVLFFIHGGGLLAGSGVKSFYDGSVFTKHGIIFIGFNYRLATLGYGPRLDTLDGSLGLMDQINALNWVIKNIEKFGGDPNRIYLMGHSKGAEAIGALIESGAADAHVKGAIAMSLPRHFKENFNHTLPPNRNTFEGGIKDKDWKTILTKVGFYLYVPELPSFRDINNNGTRVKILATSLYQEGFQNEASEMFCNHGIYVKEALPYQDIYFYLLHPNQSEHGSEVSALFTQNRFGKTYANAIAYFLKNDALPPLSIGKSPTAFRERNEVVHLFEKFSITVPFIDHGSYPCSANSFHPMEAVNNGLLWSIDKTFSGLESLQTANPSFWWSDLKERLSRFSDYMRSERN